ncbi:class I SAM-dependent methyltransferase [Agromyces italicus]|uniref:class I SAM-dependent methyltransferase n=1 Tax=Agromyces italicus TaxID=279572 RepID=UPI0003B78B96|nr:class I SAM-dependent methyltransferase [Agromyces italicus]
MIRASERTTGPEPGSAADVVRSWDARADHYLELFRDELEGKPHDLALLADFARRLGQGARVLDVGCGPCGHVAAALAAHGLDVTGLDLSPRCIELARLVQPGLRFEIGDQRTLGPDRLGGSFDGIVSNYSLHDQPKSLLPGTFAAWAAALRPGGRLLVVAKEGTDDGVAADPLGSGIEVYWAEFTAAELAGAAEAAGFAVERLADRAPYEQEIASQRLYLEASLPRESGLDAERRAP